MKKYIKPAITTLLICSIFFSCATLISGSKQSIRINSIPSGAKIIINGQDKGCTTPCLVELKRRVRPSVHNNRNEYHYLFTKEGYANAEFIDYRKLNPQIFLGCLTSVFSVIAIPIDFTSGAVYKYNNNILVNLSPVQTIPVKTNKDDIPKVREDKQHPVIKINSPDLSRGFKQTVQDEMISIAGTAYDESGLFEVLVNGIPAKIGSNYSFSIQLVLVEGSNKISIIAKDKQMNTASESFYIERESYKPIDVTSNSEIPEIGNYYALIIGIADYLDPSLHDLDEPVNDAQKFYRILTQNYQFPFENVYLLQNPTKDEITMALEKYFKTLGNRDNLLIFYAGHGYWDEKFKQGYWLAADSRTDNRGTWLSNSTIRDYIRAISCKHSLLITDACFSGGIFKSREAFPDASKAVNELYKLPSRKAITSGAMSEVPDKSVFLEYLIKRLEENEQKYLPTEQLFASFKIAVINNSPESQVPQFGEVKETGDEGGDFIFVKKE
jgi:hypothetical protein